MFVFVIGSVEEPRHARFLTDSLCATYEVARTLDNEMFSPLDVRTTRHDSRVIKTERLIDVEWIGVLNFHGRRACSFVCLVPLLAVLSSLFAHAFRWAVCSLFAPFASRASPSCYDACVS